MENTGLGGPKLGEVGLPVVNDLILLPTRGLVRKMRKLLRGTVAWDRIKYHAYIPADTGIVMREPKMLPFAPVIAPEPWFIRDNRIGVRFDHPPVRWTFPIA
jgi:hypothetical protein